jgi:SecD/SecF fusion protein
MEPMSRAALVRLVLALGILGVSVAVALTSQPRLGLDLRGGTQIVLETQDSPTVEADAEATDRALAVLRGRVDALGVAEPTLVRSGTNRIIVELPGLDDPREAARVIGRTAQLSFHAVLETVGPDAKPEKNQRILRDESGQRLRLSPAVITGEQVSGSDAATNPAQGIGWFVTVDFEGEGGQLWRELTAEAACAPPGDPRRRVAIVLDDEVISSPQVDPSVQCGGGIPGGSTQITGDFTVEEAQNLAVLIEGGALPVPVKTIEQRVIGPTLGDEAIDASFEAGIIGLILTGLFIAVVYRLMGVLATFALATYAVISYAALSLLGATLTLPGLAGFVLAIGLAIDANVLIFERAREEYTGAEGGSMTSALGIGFNKAWSAIIDSNVTTLLAAGLLFILASGPVKGFGVTLSIGVLASMVSALVIARVVTEQAARAGWLQRHPAVSGLSTTGRVREWLRRADPDIMGRSKLWLGVSVAAVLVALGGVAVNGLTLGVEFTGGRQMEYSTTEPVTADEARAAVAEAGFPNAVVQTAGEGDISVRTGQISNEEQFRIREAIGDIGGGATQERDELIGPSLGDELRSKALIAFGIALLAQLLYLAVRFKWTLAASAVLAMFHDVVIVVGIFAWLNKPIDGIFLAAALTIIGLSVNDTVVVFDRIREQWRLTRSQDMASVANQACLDTMPRTVNTGLGAMFILAALAVLGGDSLQDFAIALLLGLVVGTYSSVFTATPLSLLFHERWPLPKAQPVAKRAVRDPQDSGAVI